MYVCTYVCVRMDVYMYICTYVCLTCISAAGFHQGSMMCMWDATVRLSATPPAFRDITIFIDREKGECGDYCKCGWFEFVHNVTFQYLRSTFRSGSVLNRWMIASRWSIVMLCIYMCVYVCAYVYICVRG